MDKLEIDWISFARLNILHVRALNVLYTHWTASWENNNLNHGRIIIMREEEINELIWNVTNDDNSYKQFNSIILFINCLTTSPQTKSLRITVIIRNSEPYDLPHPCKKIKVWWLAREIFLNTHISETHTDCYVLLLHISSSFIIIIVITKFVFVRSCCCYLCKFHCELSWSM